MDNLKKYNEIFMEAFAVEEEQLGDSFSNNEVDEWDSIGQMVLISSLEEVFDIMLEDNEILELNSYNAGIEILKNHGIAM